MQKNSLMGTLKNHSIQSENIRSMKDNTNNNKVINKDSWKNITSSFGDTSTVGGGDLFSWPPRSYSCSFCKRKFRSAQALGGHMNVHRRDRARLRQSPPRNGQFSLFNLNLDPNQNPSPSPNPNLNFSSSTSHSSTSASTILFRQPFTFNLPPLVSPPLSSLSNSPSSASPSNESKIKTTKTLFGAGEFDGFFKGKEYEVVQRAEIVRLNLEIGMLSDSKNDLDLELRLGYS